MREKYSYYEFEIFSYEKGGKDYHDQGYVYKIFTEGCHPYDDGIIDSEDWFDTEQEARFAAIGHITLLENP